MKLSFAIILFFLFSLQAGAQQKNNYTDKDFARQPLWIAMMEDTAANFFVAEHAFNTYFLHHEKPEGEEAEIGEHRERAKIPSKRRLRRISAENNIRMQVKHYEVWHEQTLPYVQPDGRILTPTERLAIWRSQQRH